MNPFTIMRAKLRVVSVEPSKDADGNTIQENVTFCGVSKCDGYPPDGSDENNSFARWSPSVSLDITIANPNLFGALKQNDEFYADFSRPGNVPNPVVEEVVLPVPTVPIPESAPFDLVGATESIRKQLAVQGQEGHWNQSPYEHGFYNGLESALSALEERTPDYREAPSEWLETPKPVVLDFRGRVLAEKAELDERGDKLSKFMDGPIFGNLPEPERERMKRQICAMGDYSEVLAERIAAFDGEPEAPPSNAPVIGDPAAPSDPEAAPGDGPPEVDGPPDTDAPGAGQ